MSAITERGARGRAWRISPYWRWFWAILMVAAILRTYRIDMPPFDYPADRQRNNLMTIQALLGGGTLLGERKQWFELWIMPWLTARTYWLGKMFGAEIWTWARCWSASFGLATVALAAWAGYWAAAPPAPVARRRRLSLLFMAALAINPYHLAISRLISTESVTLAFQMAAVGCFLVATNRAGARWWILFLVAFLFACWSKIPSIIWAPGFVLGMLATRTIPPRWRIGGVILVVIAVVAGFAMIKVNPFRFFEAYQKAFPTTASQARLWIGSELWTWSFVSRILLMLTIPGMFFALIGLARAPWIFRLAFVSFLLMFYPLTNLNTYNFCHVIIPGMALAAWGLDAFVASAAGALDRSRLRTLARGRFWAARLNLAFGGGLAALLIMALYPLGPTQGPPEPRGEIQQARKAIREKVPPNTWVMNDDAEGTLYSLLGQDWSTIRPSIDLSTGWYYAIDRLSENAIRRAAGNWVAWASLPGEPGGILYTTMPNPPEPAALNDCERIAGLPLLEDTPLSVEECFVPRAGFNAADPALAEIGGPASGKTLTVRRGEGFKLAITWNNLQAARVAGIRLTSAAWKKPIAVPLREGGFSVRTGGVLCLPQGPRETAIYSFDIPSSLPPDRYLVEVYALSGDRWSSPETGVTKLPFELVVDPTALSSGIQKLRMTETWLIEHDLDPRVWNDGWLYRWMRLEGYRFDLRERYLFACVGSKPGIYRFSIRGEGTPVQQPDQPGGLWPQVRVYLPYDNRGAVATVTLADRKTRRFDVTFTATQPFDSLMLICQSDQGTRSDALPWMVNFRPVESGKQTATLREAELELLKPQPGM